MFAKLYVEALLADEDLADQVWKLWGAVWRCGKARDCPGCDDEASLML